MIRLICDKCGRKGQYRKATLVSKFGPDVVMPDLLQLIAKCENHDPMRGGCPVRYDLSEAERDRLLR